MHVLEAALVANMMHSSRRTNGCRSWMEPQIDWPLDRRQFEELTEMARDAGVPPFGPGKTSFLARLRRWLASDQPRNPAAARNVA